MSRTRTRVVAAVTAIALSLLGATAALADETVVDGDGAFPIAASSSIALGNVCVGETKSASMLVAAQKQGGGNAVWGQWRHASRYCQRQRGCYGAADRLVNRCAF